MTSQIDKQIITILILPNILRRKGNQAINSGQNFFKNHDENEVGRLVLGLLLLF